VSSAASGELKEDPARKDKHIDPRTGIWPMCEWGPECARGFTSDARFDRGNDRVIKRTNRSVTRKWRRAKNAWPGKGGA
jgi:hypothetical protein